MVDDGVHRGRLAPCLHALQLDSASVRYEVLQRGLSGAVTYCVNLGDKRIVLKVAEATSTRDVLERVQREIRFYLDLADRIPLQVPTVLGASAEASASWLCLSAEWPAPPVETWPEHWYLEVARQLGQFHATFWNSTQELSGLPWLRTHEWYPIPAILQQASASWQTLAAQPGYQRVLTPDVIGWIETMVRAVDGLDSALQSLPLTLCHGDCHHGNLLINAAGEWVWADWQEVGIGRGPEDLSFFLQRARMAGGRVPEEMAIQAYHQSLEAILGQSISLGTVKRMIGASELRTLLVFWPPFLSQISPRQLEDVVRRLRRLASGLGMVSER